MNNRIFSRRQMLTSASCGVGYLAFAGLSNPLQAATTNSLTPKQPHHPAKAKHLIFLHMRGGPAHMDTFEYKPELNKRDGKVQKNKRKLVASKWQWKQRGESGLWVSDLVSNMAKHADDICVFSGMHTDISNHTPAMLQLHTGSFAFARPSVGSWLLYGLGTENASLPGFVSMSPPLINGGAKNYGSAFLPAVYQGTALGDIKTPIKNAKISNLSSPRLTTDSQRQQLELIQNLNRRYAEQDQTDSQLNGVIGCFELAFRMQSELPKVLDVSQETQATLDMYGIGEGKQSDNYGRQCLLARRMIEAGVRHVEITDEFWDQHSALKKGHEARAAAVDLPIAGLMADLKQRGLLDETLILWGGEFGRTPDTSKDDLDGRDHNAKGYTMFLAGGGVKGGFQYGATDELGYNAVEGRTHLHDMHATILHLMGLEHTKLTYRYGGRDFRLTNVFGRVIKEVLA